MFVRDSETKLLRQYCIKNNIKTLIPWIYSVQQIYMQLVTKLFTGGQMCTY